MSVIYSDLITEPIDQDQNILKLTSDGRIITLYFDPTLPEDNELFFKDIIYTDILRIFNIDYISSSFPKPSRDQHKWIIIVGEHTEHKPYNIFSQTTMFFGDILIAQRCEGRICPIPKADLDLVLNLECLKKR